MPNKDVETSQSVKILPRIKVDYSHAIYKKDDDKSFTGNALPGGLDLPEDQQPIIKKLYEDIILCFAIDNGDNYQLLQNEVLQRNAHLTLDVLHQTATQALIQEIGENIQLKGSPDQIMMVTAGGNFEAAIILIDNFWQQIHEMLGGNIIIAIPAKDLLFICKEKNQEAIDQLKGMVKGYFDSDETDGLLSKALYLRESGNSTLKLLQTSF